MSDPNWAEVLSGVGQAVEAAFVVASFIVAIVAAKRSGLLQKLDEARRIRRDEMSAQAALEIWDAVSRAVDAAESLQAQPVRPGLPPNVDAQLEARLKLLRDAMNGLNIALGRAALLLGHLHVYEDIEGLHRLLFPLNEKIATLPYPQQTPVHVVDADLVTTAQAIRDRIITKLNATALLATRVE